MRRYELDINGKHFTIVVHDYTPRRAELEIEGTRYTVNVEDIVTEGEPDRPARRDPATARPMPSAKSASPSPSPARASGEAGGAGSVTAPIPGQILELLVEEGEVVKAGQPVLKMEAMKMENVINAPMDGTVRSIGVNAGDAVTQGQELMVVVG